MLSELWHDRFIAARDSGEDDFDTTRLAQLWGIAKPNISVSLSNIAADVPRLIEVTKDGIKNIYNFDYSLLEDNEKDTVAIPKWMSETTHNNVWNTIGDLDDYHVILSQGNNWAQQFQRGQVVITVYEPGQKRPEFVGVVLVDNCIVISDAGWRKSYREYMGGAKET